MEQRAEGREKRMKEWNAKKSLQCIAMSTTTEYSNAVRSYLGIPGNNAPMIALDYSFLEVH